MVIRKKNIVKGARVWYDLVVKEKTLGYLGMCMDRRFVEPTRQAFQGKTDLLVGRLTGIRVEANRVLLMKKFSKNLTQ